MYQKMGLVNAYETTDVGRFELTKKPEDKFVFKVPSLRNIALTAPYFHDGKGRELDDAARKMAWHQLGKKLTDDEVKAIVSSPARSPTRSAVAEEDGVALSRDRERVDRRAAPCGRIARMKAIRISAFGGPEVLQLADVPDPQPGPGQVLVRIAAAGVNPVETYIRAGTYAKLPELPCGIGLDGAGVVESVGAGVEKLRKGQRVWMHGSTSGSYAELALAEAARVHPLPDSVSFEQGAALGIPRSTAYRALFQRGGAKQGETALIHGATGGVGIAAVQFAKPRASARSRPAAPRPDARCSQGSGRTRSLTTPRRNTRTRSARRRTARAWMW